jgi:hypothetical protein
MLQMTVKAHWGSETVVRQQGRVQKGGSKHAGQHAAGWPAVVTSPPPWPGHPRDPGVHGATPAMGDPRDHLARRTSHAAQPPWMGVGGGGVRMGLLQACGGVVSFGCWLGGAPWTRSEVSQ